MKKFLAACLLALPLLAVPSEAHAWGRVEAGAKVWLRVWCNGQPYGFGLGQAGPWYSYWPLEAHFQVPAPTGYPYWPAPMTSSVLQPGYGQQQGYGQAGAAPHAPAQPQPPQPTGLQPTGYYPQAPSYWYSR